MLNNFWVTELLAASRQRSSSIKLFTHFVNLTFKTFCNYIHNLRRSAHRSLQHVAFLFRKWRAEVEALLKCFCYTASCLSAVMHTDILITPSSVNEIFSRLSYGLETLINLHITALDKRVTFYVQTFVLIVTSKFHVKDIDGARTGALNSKESQTLCWWCFWIQYTRTQGVGKQSFMLCSINKEQDCFVLMEKQRD
jgi:hypothetical protein